MSSNTTRATKVIGFSVPPSVAKQVETMARQERRTKSELFREMVRVYRRHKQQEPYDDQWINNLIAEVKAEEAVKPTPPEQLVASLDRVFRLGARRAKELGIKPKDINRHIHEYRRSKKAQCGPGY